MPQSQTELYAQAVLYLLNQSAGLEQPSNYEGKVLACRGIVNNDITGLIASVVEFVEDAVSDVDFKIETDNKQLTTVLNAWLKGINKDKSKWISSGFSAFVKQYVRESLISGFPIVKYKIKTFKSYSLPTNLWLIKPDKVKSEGNNEKQNFKYTLNGKPLEKNVFFRKDGFWYEDLPVPYLMRRGVYSNYTLKKTLKDKTAEVLKQLLWYLFMMKRGDPSTKGYKPTDFDALGTSLKGTLQDAKNSENQQSTPAFMTGLDTQAEHVMPDLSKILTPIIYEQIDKDILAGLGIIDIIPSISGTRKEAILNPKPLIQKTIGILLNVESLLYDLIREIITLNAQRHRKTFKEVNKIRIVRTPLKAFWSDSFKEMIRSFYDRGLLSYGTTLDSIGFDVQTEVARKEREAEEGLEIVFYPPVTVNREGTGEDATDPYADPDDNEDDVSEDKKGIEKNNYKLSNIENAKYKKVEDLPARVKNHMTKDLAHTFMTVVNEALEQHKGKKGKTLDALVFKTAWSAIKKISKRGKDGKWRPVKRKLKKASVSQEEQTAQACDLFNEMFDLKKLEVLKKKEKLIDKFLDENKE